MSSRESAAITCEPIVISWDELRTRKVEQRIKEQQALSRNRAYARLDEEDLPVATAPRTSVWNSTIFCLTVLGILGGVMAWGCGLLVHFKSGEQQAAELIRAIARIETQRNAGSITPNIANAAIERLREEGRSNSYFRVLTDPSFTSRQRARQFDEIEHRASLKRFLLNVLGFGMSGMLLALCLGVAEPISERNLAGVIRNGTVGAMLGLMGGAVVSLFVDKLYQAAGGGVLEHQGYTARDVLARSVAWGVLGLFLTAGAGLVMRNPRKLLIGMMGGLIGGVIGGALFDPVEQLAGPEAGKLAALLAIGLVAGLATGLIENAAKTGWLRVTAGLIAGKQFILYRNPTYIGSSPDCQIYLFRDPKVGRRHAALHLVPGGFEIEDLPLGTPTRVNGSAVSRARLRSGDKISIGTTMFLFQEKQR